MSAVRFTNKYLTQPFLALVNRNLVKFPHTVTHADDDYGADYHIGNEQFSFIPNDGFVEAYRKDLFIIKPSGTNTELLLLANDSVDITNIQCAVMLVSDRVTIWKTSPRQPLTQEFIDQFVVVLDSIRKSLRMRNEWHPGDRKQDRICMWLLKRTLVKSDITNMVSGLGLLGFNLSSMMGVANQHTIYLFESEDQSFTFKVAVVGKFITIEAFL